MKKHLLMLIGAGAALTVASSAQAAQGCGAGFHRDPYGRCYPNGRPGPVVVVPRGPAIGVFYPGHGWWDGHRYWQHRYRYNGAYRYR